MITVEKLYFSYDKKSEILKNINISIKKGEVVSLLGPNGSGKTTLLKCINSLLMPTKGAVYINEKNVSLMKRHEVARYVSYVPQEHRTSFPYTVMDVVLLGRVPYIGLFSNPKSSDIEKCYEILNSIGISYLAERVYTQISGGERKLCLIARALCSEAEVLLLDEPTSNLDMKHQIDVLHIIKKLSQSKGLTVLMTLHDPNLAILSADRAFLLKEGRIIFEGQAKDVITREKIENTYGCQVLSVTEKGMTFIHPQI